jgi:hypothetical protein
MKAAYLLPVILLPLLSCRGGRQADQAPRDDVSVLDATASVIPASLDQAMQAIEDASVRLRRGDCITVVPIVGQSFATPSDEILHRCIPSERQPYDHDLDDFHVELHNALASERRQIALHRAAKTDILGTLNLVAQEFSLDGPQVRKTLVIFSDFIEEDDSRNFITSPDLATPEAAERLARDLAGGRQHSCNWSGVRIFLGNLQSTELPNLPEPRRQAIQRFWSAYFTACKSQPFFAADGPGMSARFILQAQ